MKQELKEGGYLDAESIHNMPDDGSEAPPELTYYSPAPSLLSSMKLEENVTSTTLKIEHIASEVSQRKTMMVKTDPLMIDQSVMETVPLKTNRVKSKTSVNGDKTRYKCEVCSRHFRSVLGCFLCEIYTENKRQNKRCFESF